jgi:hypothetical protein
MEVARSTLIETPTLLYSSISLLGLQRKNIQRCRRHCQLLYLSFGKLQGLSIFFLEQFDGLFNMSAFRSILLSYTSRHLTKDSDALGAISGLLARITKMTREKFCFGHPRGDLIRSMIWKSKSSHRRKEFPSWTWLG